MKFGKNVIQIILTTGQKTSYVDPIETDEEVNQLFGDYDKPSENDQQRVKRSSVEKLVFDGLSENELPRQFETDSISVAEKRQKLNCDPVPILHLDKIETHQESGDVTFYFAGFKRIIFSISSFLPSYRY